MLAAFSSREPAPFTGLIKPEIAAPGVNILSSVFGASGAATLAISLNDANSRSGDVEGFITVTCDGQTVRVPWASYGDANVPF